MPSADPSRLPDLDANPAFFAGAPAEERRGQGGAEAGEFPVTHGKNTALLQRAQARPLREGRMRVGIHRSSCIRRRKSKGKPKRMIVFIDGAGGKRLHLCCTALQVNNIGCNNRQRTGLIRIVEQKQYVAQVFNHRLNYIYKALMD